MALGGDGGEKKKKEQKEPRGSGGIVKGLWCCPAVIEPFPAVA